MAKNETNGTPAKKTSPFAFVSADKVPARQVGGANERLAAYREQQAAERLAQSKEIAKGLLASKALTDNVVYNGENGGRDEAVKVANRAKALAGIALAEHEQRGSVRVTGSDDEGWRWFVTAVAIEAEGE